MMRKGSLLLGLALVLSACQQSPVHAAEKAVHAPYATQVAKEGKGLKTALFAGGCFWGVEGVFSHVKGVRSAISGYHGGVASKADYKAVSGGSTGHAEVVKITYDPAVIRYDQLLQIFFSVIADPTTLNYQGPDHGPQYRSALVPLSAEQRRVAIAYLAQLKESGLWKKPIVTRIESYRKFHRAESYHQDFMAAHPRHPYILAWDAPKVEALRRLYPASYRSTFQTG